MKYTLLTKAEVERSVFHERAGMINIYACGHCGFLVVCLYIDSGVTPDTISCNRCGKEAHSQFAVMKQPTRMWYRPRDLEELKDIVDEDYEAYEKEYKKVGEGESEADVKEVILANYIEHYNNGGLFIKRIT